MNQFECIVYNDTTQANGEEFVCETSWDTFNAASFQAALEAAVASANATFGGSWSPIIKK